MLPKTKSDAKLNDFHQLTSSPINFQQADIAAPQSQFLPVEAPN